MICKKKIFKFIFVILLTASICVNFYSFLILTKVKTYNTDEILDNIKYLSSDNFNGRLSGSKENLEASYFIKKYFESIDLKPFKDEYFHSFEVNFPKETSSIARSLSIKNNNKVIKEYTYAKDYKEDFINFKYNYIEFNNDNVYIFEKGIRINKENKNVIIYSNDNNSLDFRSSFIEESSIDLAILVTNSTLIELKEYLSKGNTISFSIPYNLSKTNINNVVSYIKGKDSSKPPIVVGAHFDHLGNDLENTVYHGALDNASGTAMMMAIAKYIKTLGKPDVDIIFVAFNGEEFGLKGSTAFINENLEELKNAKVFNFDMVGALNNTPISIMGGSEDSKDTPLIKEFSNILTKADFNPNYIFEDASDHAPFRKNNIEAITITNNDMSKIHTPNDDIYNIDKNSLENCFKLSSTEIINNAFEKNVFIKYADGIYKASSLFFIFLITVFLVVSHKEIKNNHYKR